MRDCNLSPSGPARMDAELPKQVMIAPCSMFCIAMTPFAASSPPPPSTTCTTPGFCWQQMSFHTHTPAGTALARAAFHHTPPRSPPAPHAVPAMLQLFLTPFSPAHRLLLAAVLLSARTSGIVWPPLWTRRLPSATHAPQISHVLEACGILHTAVAQAPPPSAPLLASPQLTVPPPRRWPSPLLVLTLLVLFLPSLLD